MHEAYMRIFRRCGLEFLAVEADSGAIGGSFSHEFMVSADSGEDSVIFCWSCGYGANLEKAELREPGARVPSAAAGTLDLVETPDVRTIDALTAFLGVSPQEVAKTLLFETDKGVVAACVRGDHQVNSVKVKNLLGANAVELASEEIVREVTGAPVGFAGPVGLSVPVYLDYALRDAGALVVGANQADAHYRNALPGRDFQVTAWADVRAMEEGDPCPRCGKAVSLRRGIEVGHIFKLGTKYSEAMGAVFLDAEGREKPLIMGCYGIGVQRTAAAAIEQNHDDDGIIWPVPIAPWEVLLLPVQVKDEGVRRATSELEQALESRGVEVLVDDRDERPGVKFKDADLLGIPLRITLGTRGLRDGLVEVRERATREERQVAVEEAAGHAAAWVDERRLR
jgi:prolyl-tRNA synthetase